MTVNHEPSRAVNRRVMNYKKQKKKSFRGLKAGEIN
jgi:hypothetical protein